MDLIAIQKALLTDDLATAISSMLALANEIGSSKLQGQIIHHSSRYHGNERGKNLGTSSPEQYERTRNQLRYALQELIKQFPDYSPEVNLEAQKILAEEAVTTATVAQAPASATAEDVLRILMLTSNPNNTAKLQLDKEYARISRQILNAANPQKFPIKDRQAVTLSEFTLALEDERPAIVHFSGHGELNNTEIKKAINRGQGLEEEENIQGDGTGIVLTSEDKREPFFVSTTIIQRIFRTMIQKRNIPIQAILFNSCYSQAQAEALKDLVPHVIGTSWSVGDEAAIAFADGFYSYLIRTGDIEAAWDNGVTQAMGYGEPEDKFIYFKNGARVPAS